MMIRNLSSIGAQATFQPMNNLSGSSGSANMSTQTMLMLIQAMMRMLQALQQQWGGALGGGQPGAFGSPPNPGVEQSGLPFGGASPMQSFSYPRSPSPFYARGSGFRYSGSQYPPVNSRDKQGIMNMARQVAQQNGIPPSLFLSMINQESGFNPRSIGDGGKSFGLGQTYTGCGDNPWFDPRRAMHGGPNGGPDIPYQLQSAARELLTKYNTVGHHNWFEAVRRYNGAGPASYRYAHAVFGNTRRFA